MAKIKILQTKRILGWHGVRWMIDSPLVKKRRPRTKYLHLTFSDTWQVYFEPRNAHQRVGCKETPCLPFLTVGKWRAFQMAMHACIACAWRCMHGDGGESVNATSDGIKSWSRLPDPPNTHPPNLTNLPVFTLTPLLRFGLLQSTPPRFSY